MKPQAAAQRQRIKTVSYCDELFLKRETIYVIVEQQSMENNIALVYFPTPRPWENASL
jgi:hypothetical protein